MARSCMIYLTGFLLCLQMIVSGCATSTGKSESVGKPESVAESDSVGKSESLDTLIGYWQGEVQEYRAIPGTSKYERITTPRTLIIYWITDETATEGYYGITGEGFGRVGVSITRNGGRVTIHFRTGAKNLVDLTLFGDTLSGVMRVSAAKMNMTLRKVSDPYGRK